MPIYEYKCDNGHVFDVMQKMSEDPLTVCVECGAPVRKVLQPVGISFKGSGFYSTDYSGKSKSEPAAKSDASSSSNSSDSNGSSDSSKKNGSGDSGKSNSDSSAKKSDSSSSSSSASKKD